MSNTRYIEINSSYRDRNLWPLPGQFEMLISQSGRKFTSSTAVDPVSDMAPITAWSSNFFNVDPAGIATRDTLSTKVVITPTSEGIDNIANMLTFIVKMNTDNLPQQLKNYYAGTIAYNSTNGQRRRISESTYIGMVGSDILMQLTVETAFTSLANDEIIDIVDPTQINVSMNGTDFANPQIFVPVGRTGTNAYVNNVLYNETRDQYRIITTYNTDTRILNVNTYSSVLSTKSSGPVSSWTVTDSYSIRPVAPLLFTNGGGATTNTVVLTGGSSENGYYKNNFLRVQCSTTSPYSYTIYPTSISGAAPIGDIRRIIDYNGTTKVATLYPSLSGVPANDMNFEVLVFSKDNFNPFIYSGSVVSQQEMVCYEIELLDLVLPNRTLNVSQGSRIAFYPYVYVEISNVSASGSGIPNSIYSNNPNSTRMTFRAAIDDVQNPLNSTFVKIDGDGMVQTLKFKPNDNLKFSVRLPNGEIYQTELSENYSPLPPNPLIQISALFAIKRL